MPVTHTATFYDVSLGREVERTVELRADCPHDIRDIRGPVRYAAPRPARAGPGRRRPGRRPIVAGGLDVAATVPSSADCRCASTCGDACRAALSRARRAGKLP